MLGDMLKGTTTRVPYPDSEVIHLLAKFLDSEDELFENIRNESKKTKPGIKESEDAVFNRQIKEQLYKWIDSSQFDKSYKNECKNRCRLIGSYKLDVINDARKKIVKLHTDTDSSSQDNVIKDFYNGLVKIKYDIILNKEKLASTHNIRSLRFEKRESGQESSIEAEKGRLERNIIDLNKKYSRLIKVPNSSVRDKRPDDRDLLSQVEQFREELDHLTGVETSERYQFKGPGISSSDKRAVNSIINQKKVGSIKLGSLSEEQDFAANFKFFDEDKNGVFSDKIIGVLDFIIGINKIFENKEESLENKITSLKNNFPDLEDVFSGLQDDSDKIKVVAEELSKISLEIYKTVSTFCYNNFPLEKAGDIQSKLLFNFNEFREVEISGNIDQEIKSRLLGSDGIYHEIEEGRSTWQIKSNYDFGRPTKEEVKSNKPYFFTVSFEQNNEGIQPSSSIKLPAMSSGFRVGYTMRNRFADNEGEVDDRPFHNYLCNALLDIAIFMVYSREESKNKNLTMDDFFEIFEYRNKRSDLPEELIARGVNSEFVERFCKSFSDKCYVAQIYGKDDSELGSGFNRGLDLSELPDIVAKDLAIISDNHDLIKEVRDGNYEIFKSLVETTKLLSLAIQDSSMSKEMSKVIKAGMKKSGLDKTDSDFKDKVREVFRLGMQDYKEKGGNNYDSKVARKLREDCKKLGETKQKSGEKETRGGQYTIAGEAGNDIAI